jgi:Tol biopolymer transport system component
MKTLWINLILATFLAVGSIYPSMAQTPEQIYQKGLMKEEGEGALQDAIDLFNQIADNSKADISLQAKSLLHIGMCYEKLGKDEATKAYQRLVNNFPGQKNEVAIARERLSRLILATGKTNNEPLIPKFRKIKIPTKLSWNVVLSPDGKDLALVSDKKLWKMPLSGNLGPEFPGTPVQLNTGDIEVEWTGLSWSGDGKWIAFNDVPSGKTENQSLYIVPAEGGQPRKLYENYRSARVVNYRISLSPDGKTLAFSSIENNKQHIQTISVEGGKPKQLVDMEAREPVISPDGRLIAYVEDKLNGVGGGSLWVIPASGGTPTLVAQAEKASSPVWSPDGSKIAFLDYSENRKIFIIPVSKVGKPAGEKITINAPEGTEDIPLLTGWSPKNEIGVLKTSKQEFALYTLPEQGGQAALVVHDVRPSQPRWSPDGKQILFMKMGKEIPLPPNHVLAVVPTGGGQDRNILIGSEDKIFIMPYQSGIRISPDGKKIVMAAKSYNDTVLINNYPTCQIWTTSVEGKNPIQITKPKVLYTDNSPCWSPDGKSIVFVRTKLKEGGQDPFGETEIYTINSSGEELKLIKSESDKWVNSINWSPDGKLVAYLTQGKEVPNEKLLNVINMESGISNIVGKVPGATVNIEIAWSPDSKRIALNDKEGKGGKIKIISLDDGSMKDIETGLEDAYLYHLDWSRDGKRFVFCGLKGGDKEFWFVENFLPLEKN